jgi:hypothetical protein
MKYKNRGKNRAEAENRFEIEFVVMVSSYVSVDPDDARGIKGGGGGLKEELRILKNVRIWLWMNMIDSAFLAAKL